MNISYTAKDAWEKFTNINNMQTKINLVAVCFSHLYNVDPLKPHFDIVKLGFTRVCNIFFLFLLKNIDCGYSSEPPRRGGSNEYPQSMF